MSEMSVNFERRANPKFVKENVEIVHYGQGGAIACRTCGGPVLTQREFAEVIGVKLNQVADFLWRRPLRPDIHAKITAAVLAVRKVE